MGAGGGNRNHETRIRRAYERGNSSQQRHDATWSGLPAIQADSAEALHQVRKLTSSLQKLQASSKDTCNAPTAEVAERHESVLRLESDAELQEKDLTASQQETIYKTGKADFSEMMGRLNSELSVQQESLDNDKTLHRIVPQYLYYLESCLAGNLKSGWTTSLLWHPQIHPRKL